MDKICIALIDRSKPEVIGHVFTESSPDIETAIALKAVDPAVTELIETWIGMGGDLANLRVRAVIV